jgi:hypothetical protein
MNFRAKGAVAHFNQNPRLLEAEDAEQALEIMLCHLSRLERIFFGRVTTWFAFYNTENNGLLSTKAWALAVRVLESSTSPKSWS